MTGPKWPRRIAGAAALMTVLAGCEATPAPEGTSSGDTPTDVHTVSAATDSHPKLSDTDITEAVESALFSDGTLHDGDVTVNTTDGVVQLIGTTDNLISKERAEQLTSTIRGVRAISNRIRVEAIQRSDTDLAHDIEHALTLDSATEAYDVDVTVHDQVVTLTGQVQSRQEQQLAERIAKGVRGLSR